MGWVLGVIGRNIPDDLTHRLRSLHPAPLFSRSSEHLYLAAGGPPSLCLYEEKPGAPSWVVVGCGIRHADGHTVQMSSDDWSERMTAARPDLSDLDGHCAALTWTDTEVRCFTDPLGLRRMYAAKITDGVVFSTQLEWIAGVKGGLEIDPGAFGSLWLTFNQLSYRSIASGVERTGPAGVMILQPDLVKHQCRPFSPEGSATEEDDFIALVERHARIKPLLEGPVAFGLSGGLDSRFLLCLLRGRAGTATAYSLGHPEEPDCVLSREIASRVGLDHRSLHEPVPDHTECLQRMRAIGSGTLAQAPATAFHKLGSFSALRDSGHFVMDGGMGEIVRRQYLNRLRIRGPVVIRRSTPAQLVQFLDVRPPTLFNREAAQVMREGAVADMTAALAGMPSVDQTGIDDFLDLMAVRYRFPNYAGVEQSRMDGLLLSVTPFCQLSVVRSSFGLPRSSKRNGRLFRSVIRERIPSLSRYPLVKDMVTYPFSFPPAFAWAWVRVRRRIGGVFHDPVPDAILGVMKPYVMDLSRSTQVGSYELYDSRLIRDNVDAYYRGEPSNAAFVDRWLSFEFLRQGLARQPIS